MHPAALLQGLRWENDKPREDIGVGVEAGKLAGTEIEKQYRRLCRSRHVDDGEPFMFDLYISVAPNPESNHHSPADPNSTLSRAANLLVVATECPVGYARIIWPKTDRWPSSTQLLWSISEWTWPLEGSGSWGSVSNETMSAVKQMWASVYEGPVANWWGSRLNNALTYFQHSWRSHHVDQACLHLSVALEVLFAPHTHSETTHQIAFNTSHFLGRTPAAREVLYEKARRFYAVRSTIIHGGSVDHEKVEPAVIDMFGIVAGALRAILTDKRMTRIFASDNDRKRLFRSYMFGE